MDTRIPRIVPLAVRAALAATLIGAWPAPAQEPQPAPPNAWQLVYARTAVADGDSGDAASRESESIVLLAGDLLGVLDSTGDERIYDFKRRRINVIDRDAGVRLVLSLYADVAARERQLAAQEGIRERSAADAADAAGVPTRVESETYFGMRGVEPARPEIRERDEDGTTVYNVDGRDTVWFRPSTEPLPDAVRPALERYLAWRVHLHPAVRDRIVATGRAPLLLRTRFPSPRGPELESLQLRFSGATAVDWAKPFEGLRPGTLDDTPSSVAAHRILAGQLDAPAAYETYVADARRLAQGGAALDAALAQLAALSAYGRRDEELAGAIVASGDPGEAALRGAVEGLTDSPEDALSRIDALTADGLEYGHVLDLLRASAYDALGRRDAALARYDSALAVDPYLTGAWCDLGRLHFRAERMPLAWLAWDAARAVRPDHPAVAPIDALEASLRERFPAFF